MRIKAFGAKGSAPVVSTASASSSNDGRLKLNSRAPPPAAPTFRKVRRDRPLATTEIRMSGSLHRGGLRLRCVLDRGANAQIGAAAADVAGHGRVDIGIAGMLIVGQQRGRGHDLSRLAVAALDDLQ